MSSSAVFLCVPGESTHSCRSDLITSGNNQWFCSNAQELQAPHGCPSTSHQPFQHLRNTRLIQIPLVEIPDPLCFIRKVCFYSYFSWSLEIKVLATANVRHISRGEKVMYLFGYPYCSLIRTINHQVTCQRNKGLVQNLAFTGVFADYNPNYNSHVMILSLWQILNTLTGYLLLAGLIHFPQCVKFHWTCRNLNIRQINTKKEL